MLGSLVQKGVDVKGTPRKRKPLGPRGVAIASLIGTTIEYYDLYVYSTSVVVVLSVLFFPTGDALTSSLVALSTIGVAFLAKPLGGIVFAHFGDRIGRKNTLIVSLWMMGLSTVCVGLLPTYEQAGILAPVMLIGLRFVQGLAAGGEWGGAVLLAFEHAPTEKRAFYSAFPMFGSPLGMLGSAGVIAAFQMLPEEAFRSWGWRVPFLLSVVLLVIGVYLRRRLEEPEQFVRTQGTDVTVKLPIAVVLQQYWRVVLLGVGVCFVSHAGFIIGSFLPSFMVSTRGLPGSAVTTATLIASSVCVVALAVFVRRVDGYRLTRVTAASGILVALWSFPAFAAGYAWGGVGLIVAMSVNFVLLAPHMGAMPALVTNLFPANIRYTGISTTYQLTSVVGGGLLPILTSYLVGAAHGSFWPAALLMSASGLLTAVASYVCGRYVTESSWPKAAEGAVVAEVSH